MIELRHIEIFTLINRTGSITAAARALGVSQPAVSRMLGHLEDRLGFDLFARSGTRLIATAEGRKLFEVTEVVHDHVQHVRALAAELKSGGALPFRIAMNPSLGLSIGPQALSRFRDRLPEVPLRIEIEPSGTITELMTQGRIDIAVVLLPIENAAIESVEIGQARIVCVLPKGHALAGRDRISPRDLAEEPLISYDRTMTQGLLLDEAFAADGVSRNVGLTVRFAHVAASYVAGGFGVALVDEFSVSDAVAATAEIRPFVPALTFTAYAAWPASRPRPRHADALVEAFSETIARRSLS